MMRMIAGFLCSTAIAVLAVLPGGSAAAHGDKRASGVVVQPALGGQILGYDIDRNGTEGILSESLTVGVNNYDVATETFDQATGKILKIVKEEKDTTNDFDTYAVAGKGVGLVLYQKLGRNDLYKNIYEVVDPLKTGRFTGTWTPKLGAGEFIGSVSEDQGHRQSAVMAFNDNSFQTEVFSTDVAANSFGTAVPLTDTIFDLNDGPVMAFDPRTNIAAVAASIGCRTCGTEIGLVDLAHGAFSEFAGLGFGTVNGIAVDSADGIACTTTEIDAGVEFYDLAKQTGFETQMEGSGGAQSYSGADVEFDPVNRLFLIGQEYSSTGNGSSVEVFDTKGNFVESINGLSLPASPARIALNPNTRTAFVVAALGTELQSFSY